MKGLLTDINVQGLLPAVEMHLAELGYTEVLRSIGLRFYTFPDLGLNATMGDREVWLFCQAEGLVLLTDNRNKEDDSSLQATLNDSLRVDSIPVLTPGDKQRFQNDRVYQRSVVEGIAEVLFSVTLETKYLGIGRIFLPLPEHA